MTPTVNDYKKAAVFELRRRAARAGFAPFVLFTTPNYKMGWVHREICETLEQFGEPSKNVIIVFVCTDKDMKETEIAVLPYEDACRCMGLGQDTVNKQRKISVQYIQGARKFRCYGTGLSSDNAVETPHNYEKVFGLTSGDEE